MDARSQQPPADAASSDQAHPENVQLFATGLNAHGQLSAAQSGKDLSSFTALTAPAVKGTVRLLYAGWSYTQLQIGAQLVLLHNESRTFTVSGERHFDCFGDHNGPLGFLDVHGQMRSSIDFINRGAEPDGSPLLGHVAVAGNEEVAVTFKQAPNGRLCHVLCFAHSDDLFNWYESPADVPYDAEKQHTMMQGQPRQLLAGTGTFLLRMENGEVYSWGDARYSSLGRSIAETPAGRPGLVEALGGLKIKKIACGGWLNAALSEDGACYLWGSCTPGTDQTIKCLGEVRAGELALVELPDEDGDEPLDIIDVAVGDNHVVLLAEGNRCFAAGENKNGQLGLGHIEPFVEDWTAVSTVGLDFRSIACGPKSTFAFAARMS